MGILKNLKFWKKRNAEEDKTALHFEQQLVEERIKNYEEQQRLLAKWRNAKNEREQVRAEKEKYKEDFKEQLTTQRRKNYNEQQMILKKLWYINRQLEETKAEKEKEKEDLEEQLRGERRRNSDNEKLMCFLKDELEVTKAEKEKEKEDLEEQLRGERRRNSDNEKLMCFLKDELEVTKAEKEKEKEDLEEQLRGERRRNSDNEKLMCFLKDELEVTKAEKEKEKEELEEQLREEKRRNYEKEELICFMKDELEVTKAEKEIEKEELEEQLREEKRRNYENEDLMCFMKDELEVTKAELQKLRRDYEQEFRAVQRLKNELREERRNHLHQEEGLLEELCKAYSEVEEINAKKSAPNFQLAADRIEPQQGHLVVAEQNAARCGGGHGEGSSLNDFTFLRVLGQGGFGKVLLAECKSRGRRHHEGLCAVKVLKKENVIRNKCVKFVEAERDIMNLVHGHPLVITLFTCFQTKENLFFVMEFAEGGDLRSLLQLVQIFIEPVATFYAAEIALALQFLHKKGIVHRDLKPDNILLDKEGHIKVSDFGLAKCGMFGETRTKSFCGTHEYMAPEIALRLLYGHEVDWWALGVTIYEMLAGHRPFWPHDDFTVLDSIVYDSIWYPESLSREAVSILQGFLRRDPSRRLVDPDDIRSHPFFKPVEWEELEKKQERPPFRPKPVKASKQNVDIGALITPAPRLCDKDQELFRGFSKNCGHQNFARFDV